MRAIRGILIALGLLVFVVAIVAPRLRRPDGWLMPLAWTLAVGGVSLTLLGFAWRTRWQRFAGLLSLALIGQAFTLQLLDVGPSVKLQHYFSWVGLLAFPQALFLLALLVQTAIIAWLARSAWPSVQDWIPRLRETRLIIVLGFMGFATVIFSPNPLRYLGELGLAGWVLIINALTIVFVAAAMPQDALTRGDAWLRRYFSLDSKEEGLPHHSDRLVPWMVAAWVTALSSFLACRIFEGIPHVPDSVAYLFQAKYFARTQLYLPSPPDATAFAIPHTINDGSKWYSIFPPGWPAVLAVGVWLGVPWLVNPLLAGCTVLIVHRLISRLYSRSMAHAAVGLLAVSPMFLFMSASLLSHPLSVVCSLIALLGVHNTRTSGRARWAIVAGMGLGVLVLTRPFEGVLVGVVTGLWALGVGARRLALSSLLAFGVTSVGVGGLLLPYNQALTGHAIYDPITKSFDEKYYPGSNRLGFGKDIGNVGWTGLDIFPGHGLVDVIVNANQNFYMLNFDLFSWSFGSLWFAALLLLWRRLIKADAVFLAIVLTVIGGLSLYWFSGGPDFGARYWYQTLVPMIVLSVRGVQSVEERLIQLGAPTTIGHRLWVFVAVASLAALVNVLPWRALDKFHNYRGMRADIRVLSREYGFGHSLVLIQGKYIDSRFSEYSSAAIFNPPTLQEPGTIFARDLGATRTAALRKHFADRPVWVVASPSLTGRGMQVVAGPLPASRPRLITHPR